MRIGIAMLLRDERSPESPSGTIRYVAELANTLARVEPRHAYVVYLEQRHRRLASLLNPHRVRLRILSRNAMSWHQRVHMAFPAQLASDRIDLVHLVAHAVPFQSPCPVVVTIHDIIPLVMPWAMPPRSLASTRVFFPLATRVAAHLIVPSKHTKQDLIRHLNVPSHKISVIPQGCSPAFRPVPKDRAVRYVWRRFRLRPPYLLTVGDLVPHKNLPAILGAFWSLTGRLRGALTLALVGSRDARSHSLLRLIKQDPRIRYLEAPTDVALRYLYAAAECLVMASFYEGFGLPPLEAMACGTPVVVSRCTSLPEVVGNAGLLVEPGSVRRLADALETLLSQPALQAQLRQRGLARARRFSWDVTARQTLAVYQQVMERSRASDLSRD